MKKRRTWLAGLVAAPFVIAIAFLLAAWIGSSIPRNADREPPAKGVEIMVETNGIHTGIVMPVVTQVKDWRETFPSAGQRRADGRMPTHVAIGWGEKEVFLNTPTWGDLRIGTVLRILFSGGDGLMRVAHYHYPQPTKDHRPVLLTQSEYARLVEKVEMALPAIEEGEVRKNYDSFEPGARNYDAAGRYTAANTCNQWVGDTLAYAGIEMGMWTPLAGGVMKWIPPANAGKADQLSANLRSSS